MKKNKELSIKQSKKLNNKSIKQKKKLGNPSKKSLLDPELTKLIIENSTDGIILIDENYKIDYVNRQLAKMIGTSAKFLINKDFRSLLDDDNKKIILDRYKSRINKKKLSKTFIFPYKKSKNEIKYFEVSSTVFSDSKGNIKTLSQFTDITEKRLAEIALTNSEEKFRSIVEFSHLAILIINSKYKFEYANKQSSKLLACPIKKIIGTDFRQFLSEESLEITIKRYRQRQEGKKVPSEYEICLIARDGQKKYALLSSTTVTINNEVKTFAQLMDITKIKRNEKLQKTLLNISQELNVDKNLHEFLDTIRNLLSEILDTTNFYVALYNKENDTYTFPYHVDEYDTIDDITQIELKNSLTDYVRRKNKAILVNEKIQDELEKKKEIVGVVGENCPVWLGAPLVVDNNVVGVIGLQNYHREDAYSLDDLEILKIISENVSSAIWRKQIIDQLSISELRYRDFIARTSEGIYRIDLNPPIDISLPADEQAMQIIKHGNIGECNNSFARMYGLNNYKDILGRNLNTFYGNKISKENFEANKKFVLEGYRINDVETYEESSNGDQLIILNNSIGIIEKGYLTHIWGIQKDITESKLLNTALKHIAVEQSSKDTDSVFSSMVNFLTKSFNVSAAFIASIEDSNKLKLISINSDHEVKKGTIFDFTNTISEKINNSNFTLVEENFREIRKGNFYRQFKPKMLIGKLLKNSKGHPLGQIVILNKEKLKKIEFIKSIIEIFATRAETELERITHLNALVEAKEEAEKSNKLKSDFLAQMSHEIRTPVNTILSFSSLIKETMSEQMDEEQKEYFDIIEQGGRRLIRTIDLILNVSQVQSGNMTLTPKDIDLVSTIKNLVLEFRQPAIEKNLDLVFDSRYKKLMVLADNYTLTQIFANLIHNSIKYTNKGFIKITLEMVSRKKVIVKIIDSGIGISSKYLNELFDPFSQEETGYTRKFEGTGLGLTLVKNYCDLNNAEIKVESKKNKGTTFSVIFKK